MPYRVETVVTLYEGLKVLDWNEDVKRFADEKALESFAKSLEDDARVIERPRDFNTLSEAYGHVLGLTWGTLMFKLQPRKLVVSFARWLFQPKYVALWLVGVVTVLWPQAWNVAFVPCLLMVAVYLVMKVWYGRKRVKKTSRKGLTFRVSWH